MGGKVGHGPGSAPQVVFNSNTKTIVRLKPEEVREPTLSIKLDSDGTIKKLVKKKNKPEPKEEKEDKIFAETTFAELMKKFS